MPHDLAIGLAFALVAWGVVSLFAPQHVAVYVGVMAGALAMGLGWAYMQRRRRRGRRGK